MKEETIWRGKELAEEYSRMLDCTNLGQPTFGVDRVTIIWLQPALPIKKPMFLYQEYSCPFPVQQGQMASNHI